MADFDNKAEELKGKAKETYGDAAGDKKVENEGKGEQASANIKDKASEAGDKIKDKTNEVLGAFKSDDKK